MLRELEEGQSHHKNQHLQRTPSRSAGDGDLPTTTEIKQRIGGLYNVALAQATKDYPNIVMKQQTLTEEDMENMPVNLKTKY